MNDAPLRQSDSPPADSPRDRPDTFPANPERERRTYLLLALVAISALFASGLRGGFVRDDRQLLLAESHLRGDVPLVELLATPFWGDESTVDSGVAPVYRTIHRPLVKLYLNRAERAFGAETFGYHAVSILLHLVSTMLVVHFLRRRPGRVADAGDAFPIAFALLFAVHPTRVESVTWITGIPDLAMTMFVLAGVALASRRSPIAGAGAVCALALAGWSKETAVLSPILLGFDAWARGGARSDVRRTVGLASLASALVCATWFVATRGVPRPSVDPGGGTGITFFPRVLGTIGAFAERVVWPHPATMFPGGFGLDDSQRTIVPIHFVVVGVGITVSIAALVVASIRRPSLRGVAADALWFIVPLAPVANAVLRSGSALIADRFLYLPLVGAAALGLWLVDAAVASARVRSGIAYAALVAVAITSAIETYRSIGRFEDQLTLFEHETRARPMLPLGSQEVISELEARGEFDRAARVALVAARTFSGGRSPTYEGLFVLDYLRMLVHRLPESDQATLGTIRSAIDDLGRTGRLSIVTPSLRYERKFRGVSRATIVGDRDRFHLLLALACAKTLDFACARTEAEAIVARAPGQIQIGILAALARAHLGDFDGALGTLRRLREVNGPDPRLDESEALLTELRGLARLPLTDPRERAVRDANVALRLGSPEASRRILVPLLEAEPRFAPAVAAFALAENADGHREAALALLDRELARTEDALLRNVRAQIVDSPIRRIAGPGGASAGPR